MNMTNNPSDTVVALHSRTPSNISEPNKSSTSAFDTSKTSTRSSKTSRLSSENRDDYDRMPMKPNSTTPSTVENSNISLMNKQRTETPTPSKHEQKSTTSSIYNSVSHQSASAPPQSRASADIPQRRSQSVSSSRIPSSASSTIAKEQSQPLINVSVPSTKSNQISHATNPSATDSHLSQSASKITTHSNQISRTSTENHLPNNSHSGLIKANSFQRPQVTITDSIFDEFHSQPNTQHISA